MKETGPIVIALIIFAAILLSMHNNGGILKTRTSSTSSTHNTLTPAVRGASTSGGYQNASPFSGDVSIDDVMEPGTFAGSEYIKLSTSTDEPINITGWSIVSEMTGNRAYITNASNLPLINAEGPIIIKGYQDIILASGSSPIDISFRTNMCTGYFEEKNFFNPSLSRKCPSVDDYDLSTQIEDSDTCMEYLNSLSTCELPKKSLPNMPSYCKNFVQENISYQGCVNSYKNSSHFYENEWRVFLKSRVPLWRQYKDGKNNQEILKLLDAQSRVVDTFSY